jgi:HTH-type transcriptional regulator/antitoxin HigA
VTALSLAKPRLPRSYFKLVEQFPLTHVRNDNQLMAAQAVIDRLLERDLDEGEQEYLDALSDLVESYEDEHIPIPAASEADVLRELMRANGLTQGRLANKVGIAQSTISAVLNGTRSLTKVQVLRLAGFFNVSPTAFLPASGKG